MKRKLIATSIALALALAAGTTAFAASATGESAQAGRMAGRRATGSNRNYVCFMDENKDGICDNKNQGTYFVDENGDGICDNRATQSGRPCSGQRNGSGSRSCRNRAS